MQAPSMPKGSRTLISCQLACLRLTPPSTSDAVKSRARTSGTANCSGCERASSGTEISAEPKPVIPRMKYALIRMHKTRTMSATTDPLIKLPSIAALSGGYRLLTLFCNRARYLPVYYGEIRSSPQAARGAALGLLERLQGRRDNAGATF